MSPASARSRTARTTTCWPSPSRSPSRSASTARWFHYGLTSSDVVDTALALQLGDAGRILLEGVDAVDVALRARAEEHRHTPTIGRTHGVHAEPTTFGLKLLGWLCELRRGRVRLEAALAGVRVGKLSGAVGAYANTDPRSRSRPSRPSASTASRSRPRSSPATGTRPS